MSEGPNNSSASSESDEETTLPAGARLGKYQIIRLLGAGGMGSVYEGRHMEIGKRVAIKTLSPAVAAIPGARQRFLREAQLTSCLNHPHVVDLMDMGTEGRVAYLVMELLAGEDLSHRLERTGRMPPREIVDLMLPVCSALTAAHDAGIVHRDLKPQNIFLANGPRGVEPKVLDFGISKSSDSDLSGLTSTGSVMGTPHYIAPEQIKDARTASAASDQYAIGVIFYKCLTNKNPFEGDSIFGVLQAIVTETAVPLIELRSDLPDGLERVVARAMSRLPWDRFASVRDLGRALLPYASAKARIVWEEPFAARTPTTATVPERESHTMPATPPPALFTPAGPAARVSVGADSGTLTPAVTSASSFGLGATTRTRGRHGKMIVGTLAGLALAVGAFAVLTRGSSSAPAAAALSAPAVPTPTVAAAAVAPAAATPPPIAPAAATPPPPAAPAPIEEPRAKAAASTLPAEEREAEVKSGHSTKAESTKVASTKAEARHRHAGSHARPATPTAPAVAPTPRNLNPNRAPVID